jgi:hypothetical protein
LQPRFDGIAGIYYNPNALERIPMIKIITTAAVIAPHPQPAETLQPWLLVIPGSSLRM